MSGPLEARGGGGVPRWGWAAVVVNYNSGAHLAPCVASLLAQGGLLVPGAGALPVEVVVVDNASTDGAAATLSPDPRLRLVAAGANLGYARAANLGIAATTAPVVAVLNPDTVMGPGAGAALLGRFAAEADLGALGPRVTNPDGSVYPSARSLPSLTDAIGHGLCFLVKRDNPFTRRYRQTGADPDLRRDVDWVSGAAVWLRRAALDEVGGWDERYFMYVEDVDVCWRLRRGGWRVAYEPDATVSHRVGASTSAVPYRMIAAHHRSLYRFAASRFTGRNRVLLPPAAAFLTLRGAAAMAHHRFAGR